VVVTSCNARLDMAAMKWDRARMKTSPLGGFCEGVSGAHVLGANRAEREAIQSSRLGARCS
jgi:hypothetical protein